MRNDVIEFVFDNPDGSEVLLRPRVVADLASDLERILSQIFERAVPGANASILIDLVNIRPGSQKVSYAARVAAAAAAEFEKAPIAASANIGKLLAGITAVVAALAVSAGVAVPARSDATLQQPPPEIEQLVLPMNIHSSLQFSIEEMVQHAVDAGASQVIMRLPDQPELILTIDGATDPRLIGSAGNKIESAKPFDGHLALSAGESFPIYFPGNSPIQTARI